MKSRIGILITGLLFAASSGAWARTGPGGGGGGDPLANDFLDNAKFVQSLLTSPRLKMLDVDPEAMGSWIAKVYKSLDGKNPQLIFPPGETLNCFGSTKVGCTENGRIRIARDGYAKMRTAERWELAALEFFVLMDVKDRYLKSRMISDFIRFQMQTIEGHVLFIIRYQLSEGNFKGDQISPTTCTRIGRFIEQTDKLFELTQLLVMQGTWELSRLKAVRVLSDAARELFPFCGINLHQEVPRDLGAADAKINGAIKALKDMVGPPEPIVRPTITVPVEPIQLVLTPKPGLAEGQKFRLVRPLVLQGDLGTWNYFSDGQYIGVEDLLNKNGAEYCAITNEENTFPKAWVRDGNRYLPAMPMELYEISWYVDTVFFRNHVSGEGAVKLVVYCNTMRNNSLSGKGLTSLDAIKKNLRGILQPTF